MGDRRFETRRPALEPVALVWTAAAAEHQDTGTLRDVSRSGARIHLEHPVPVNTSVRATIRGVAVTAQVRSCARQAPGFIIGLEFDPEFQGKVRTRPA